MELLDLRLPRKPRGSGAVRFLRNRLKPGSTAPRQQRGGDAASGLANGASHLSVMTRELRSRERRRASCPFQSHHGGRSVGMGGVMEADCSPCSRLDRIYAQMTSGAILTENLADAASRSVELSRRSLISCLRSGHSIGTLSLRDTEVSYTSVRASATVFRSEERSKSGFIEQRACSLDVTIRVPRSGGADVVEEGACLVTCQLVRSNEYREQCWRRHESCIGQ